MLPHLTAKQNDRFAQWPIEEGRRDDQKWQRRKSYKFVRFRLERQDQVDHVQLEPEVEQVCSGRGPSGPGRVPCQDLKTYMLP